MNLLYSDILGKINGVSIDTIAYESYEHKIIDDTNYIFGMGRLVRKKYYTVLKDGRGLSYQMVYDNKILFDFLKLADRINKGQFKSFKNFRGELIDIDLEKGDNAPTKPTETFDKNTIELIIKFCNIYGLLFENCILGSDEGSNLLGDGKVSEHFDVVWDTITENGFKCGLKVDKFLTFINDIYIVFKNWEFWKNSSKEFVLNETNKYKHRKIYGSFLFFFIEHLNNLQCSIQHEIYYSPENNSFKEICSVASLPSLIAYQLKALITESINVKKCENQDCGGYFIGRENRRFCSSACKQQYYRNNKKCNVTEEDGEEA